MLLMVSNVFGQIDMCITIKPFGHILENSFQCNRYFLESSWMNDLLGYLQWVFSNLCLEKNDSKCAHRSSVDDTTNNHIFFTNNTSTFNCPFLWQIFGNSILMTMYDTQSCTSGVVTSGINKSCLIRRYNNRLSLSDMLGESVFS